MRYITNPILPGFNPDPSICRVGEDFYIVNSSFEFFPGVPIYHSTNLVNWELIGYCLTDSVQLPLKQCRPSGGIFAPTIRWHQGTFFMTTTNAVMADDKKNFIVFVSDMGKGWSEPVWVDQEGIDPSLLFDEDGTVYFTSAGSDSCGIPCILSCEINPYTGERLSESRVISYGCGGKCVEAPHLYRIKGMYYLIAAEGGTEYGHMVTIQRSDNPYGPFEPCPRNPVLSHRDDSRGEIFCTGHGDLTEDQNGNWWMVCLGTRGCDSENGRRLMMHHLGRETFLVPIDWDEDGWPVVGEDGKISLEMEGELPGSPSGPVKWNFHDDFTGGLSLHYNYLRNPEQGQYQLCTAEGTLTLKGTEITLDDQDSPTWLGIRQKEFDTEASVTVGILNGRAGVRTGLTAYYNDSYHYEIYLTEEDGTYKVCLSKHVHDLVTVTASASIDSVGPVTLKLVSDRVRYRFLYRANGSDFKELGSGLNVGLCTEGTKSVTYTGTYIGLFAENGWGIFRDFDVKFF